MALHPDSQQAIQHIRQTLAPNQKLVLVTGDFNIVHPGHLRLLRFAAECGDFLVVGVYDQHSPNAVIEEELRLDNVDSIEWVNHAFILRDTAIDLIEVLQPHIVVKGKEHAEFENPERGVIERYGGKLLFGSGDIRFSSIDLLRSEFQQLNFSTIEKPLPFLERHHFTLSQLKSTLDRMKGLRVGVIGDLIIDEYIRCDPLGMSREDPTIVVTPILQEKFIGGAGIVAAHARGLGAEVHFLTVTGHDQTADFAHEKLKAYGIQAHLYPEQARPTTLKQRFIAENNTLLRVSHLRQHTITQETQHQMRQRIQEVLPELDLLIFSDFNYGSLPQGLVNFVIELCHQHEVMMVADSQCSSQVGDISRFSGMQLLTPTEREARLALHDFDSGLVILSEKLRQKSKAQNIILTLGAEGLLMHVAQGPEDWLTDRLPAFNRAPKDLAGAGDSLLTASSMALAVGASIWEGTYLGSLAAACQVGRTGNIPLSPQELISEIGY